LSRDPDVYLQDMLSCCEKVRRYVERLDLNAFKADELTFDAVLRNLEVLGEAAKRVPEDVRRRMPGIDWRGASGLRDVLIHGYSGIEADIVWDVVRNKLPAVEAEIRRVLGRGNAPMRP